MLGPRMPSLAIKNEDGTTTKVDDNAGMAKVLYEAFFFQPPEESTVSAGIEYPEPCEHYSEMTTEQLRRAIKKVSPYKAPGDDDFPNAVFTYNRETLIPVLIELYRATVRLKYYPAGWKGSSTVVLPSPLYLCTWTIWGYSESPILLCTLSMN